MGQLIRKPAELSWEAAGSLYVVGVTAYVAVRAVSPQPGETVAVSAAAGGVGSLVVQLLALREAAVLGIGGPDNADWLRDHGAVPIAYGADFQGLAERLREAAPDGIDAFIDLFGPDYIDLAVDLGVAIDFDIAATFPLEQVADAFEVLERRHTDGKIVLVPNGSQ